MPKIDTYSLLQFSVPVETRTFTDQRQPGQELTLTLKVPEFDDRLIAQQIAQKLIAKWVSPPSGKRPPPFPPPPMKPIRWSEPLCRALALFVAIQRPENPEETYDAEDLALISMRMPTAWAEVSLWFGELEDKMDQSSGNGSAAPGETPCAPPANLAAPIPPSIITSLSLSGASTNG